MRSTHESSKHVELELQRIIKEAKTATHDELEELEDELNCLPGEIQGEIEYLQDVVIDIGVALKQIRTQIAES